MRPVQSLLPLAVCLSSIIVPAAASPWPGSTWLSQLNPLMRRQDSSSSSSRSSPDPTPASTATADSTAPRTEAGQNTARPTSKARGTGTKDSSDSQATETIPPDAPPGGVSMLSPSTVIEPLPLYKRGDHVSWKWNYTSLIATPTAVDVLISCQVAAATWTLTSNMTAATSAEFDWDSSKEANSVEQPLVDNLYTLIIVNSESTITDRPKPGELSAATALTFGIYKPKPATAFADWRCVGCSGASALYDAQALRLAVVMSFITLLSFTWFVAGLELH